MVRAIAIALTLAAVVTIGYRAWHRPAHDPGKLGRDASQESSAFEALAQQVKERSAFHPKAKKASVKGRFKGILGDQARFDDKWLGVGGEFMGAKILALGPDWVEYEYKGKTHREWVFGERKQSDSRVASREGEDSVKGKPSSEESPAPLEDADAGKEHAEGSGDAPPAEMSREMMERLRQMEPEQRDALLDRLPNEVRDRVKKNL